MVEIPICYLLPCGLLWMIVDCGHSFLHRTTMRAMKPLLVRARIYSIEGQRSRCDFQRIETGWRPRRCVSVGI